MRSANLVAGVHDSLAGLARGAALRRSPLQKSADTLRFTLAQCDPERRLFYYNSLREG